MYIDRIDKRRHHTHAVYDSEFSLGGMATLGLMSMELFPIIDPLLILYFVQGLVALS